MRNEEKVYHIGDKAWYAGTATTKESMVCPECFGKKYLTVILGDGSQVTIDCAGCSSGFNPPTGMVFYYKRDADVREITIDRVEISVDKVECGSGCYRMRSDEVFATREEAKMRASELVEEYNKEELAKINRKDKHHKDWAWHVHYYRDRIRNAEKDLAFLKEKLAVAESKVRIEQK